MSRSDSFLTAEEESLLGTSGLHRKSWFLIRHVCGTYFSTCRHFGGGIIQGSRYTYNPKTDELIRDDVLQWVMKRRRETAKAEKARLKELKAKSEKRLF